MFNEGVMVMNLFLHILVWKKAKKNRIKKNTINKNILLTI